MSAPIQEAPGTRFRITTACSSGPAQRPALLKPARIQTLAASDAAWRTWRAEQKPAFPGSVEFVPGGPLDGSIGDFMLVCAPTRSDLREKQLSQMNQAAQ